MKPAVVRFYFDADILGVGKVIGRLREDCTFPGDPGAVIHRRLRPACVIAGANTPDEEWIGSVSAQGLIIITRDRAIQRRPAELDAVKHHNARMVTLASADAKDVWRQLEVVMTHWRGIENLASEPGPFVYQASRMSMATGFCVGLSRIGLSSVSHLTRPSEDVWKGHLDE